MAKNLGFYLDDIEKEVKTFVTLEMERYQVPPSLMDKVLNGVQSHIRQLKAEEYAADVLRVETHEGGDEDAVRSNTGKDYHGDTARPDS